MRSLYRLINRYRLAQLFCWTMRKLGYAVMLYPDHFGHQCVDVEYDLRHAKTKLLYLAGIIPNNALLKMHRRYVTVIWVPNFIRVFFVEANLAYACLDQPLSRDLSVYRVKENWSGPPALEFSEEEKAYGDSVLAKLGIEKGKYVCFHARDSRYASIHHPKVMKGRQSKRMITDYMGMDETHPFQRHRNVDFASYYKAIEWLGHVGLRAVRLGSDVEKPFGCENLIDYASQRNTFENPELLDLYLIAHCKLYVGHLSGVTHSSVLWNTPGVCVSCFPYCPASQPTANFTACRVKKLKVLGETLSEFRSRHFFELANWPQIYEASWEIEVIDNTPDEILGEVQKAIGQPQRLAA